MEYLVEEDIKDSLFDTGKYLVHMLSSLLQGEKPKECPENVNFQELFRMAKYHGVANMAWYGVEQLERQPDSELSAKWKEICDKHVVKSFVQMTEIEYLLKCLTDASIKVLPMKGCLLKDMYPQIDHRMMADLDILVDESRIIEVKKIMEDIGYTTESFGHGNHDIYKKPPVLNVEIHREIMPNTMEFYHYFTNENVWDRAIQNSNQVGEYFLSWDDYYIFMIAHYFKHFIGQGSGIRSIMDIYVFLSRHRQDLNEKYIKEELYKIGLNDFRNKAEAIAAIWFDDAKEGLDFDEMERYILSNGIYGTKINSIRNGLRNENGSASRYLMKRIFLGKNRMIYQYPCLNKYPYLLPLCWGDRIVKATLFKGDAINQEIKRIKYAKSKK